MGEQDVRRTVRPDRKPSRDVTPINESMGSVLTFADDAANGVCGYRDKISKNGAFVLSCLKVK